MRSQVIGCHHLKSSLPSSAWLAVEWLSEVTAPPCLKLAIALVSFGKRLASTMCQDHIHKAAVCLNGLT